MLIKEYRIPLPLTVEEYRIAQLFMIAVSEMECSRTHCAQHEFVYFISNFRKKVGKRAKVPVVVLRFSLMSRTKMGPAAMDNILGKFITLVAICPAG